MLHYLIFACLVHAISSADTNIEEHVLVLTDDTINATVQNSGQHVLVVDATQNRKAADWLAVKGYPTLIWFSNGDQERYSGGRTKDGIVSWIRKRVLGLEKLDSVAELRAAAGKTEVFLLGYICDKKHPALEALEEASKQIEEWPVYFTDNNDVAKAVNVSVCESFAVGTSFDYNRGKLVAVPALGHKAFDGDLDSKKKLVKFVQIEQLPPYLPYSSATNERIFALERQVFLLGPLKDLQPSKLSLTAVEEVHKQFKGDFAFATAALGTDPANMLLDFFGLRASDEIQVVGFVPEEKKYKLREDLTAESLTVFCKGIMEDSYPRFYKTAPLPKRPVDGFVRIVVGSSFDSIVLDREKDVFLLVYTTWSDKSKHMAVVWRKMAEHMRHVHSLVIAKIEAEANEHPHLTGDAYPYALFYPAGSDQGVRYSGQVNLKELMKFVREHAVVSIDFKANPPKTAQDLHSEL